MLVKIKKTIFMLRKLINDILRDRQIYELSDDMHSNQLGKYYLVFAEDRLSKGKDQALITKFNQNGIPINKTYIDVIDKDYVYFPISIGQMGLAVFHTYLKTHAIADRDRFLHFAEWFYNNAERDKILGVRWLTDVPLPQYKNSGHWQSAFAQGRGISILLRGYQLTGEKKYAQMAEQALIPFTKPVAEGGVTSFTKWGPFYEEYTAEVPTLVLNGMIFSLCGVYDFMRVLPENQLAKKIFSEGIQTLRNILLEYDLGYWSRYNKCRADWYPEVDPATAGYQRLHVVQLQMLYRLTGEVVFKEYADKFRNQDNLKNILKMYRVKYSALKKLKRL